MLKGRKDYTISDIEVLPEGERAELINGELFRMDAPTWTHQAILVKLILKIGFFIDQNKGNCKVMPAPFAVYIKKDRCNYVEPDISVICDEEKKSEKGCQGAPDWIIDPETEMVTVYDFERTASSETNERISQELESMQYAFSERI